MATFIVRRLIASIFIFLAATYLMYILTALSGDPLEDLRTSTAPNKQQLIEARTALLHLDVPPYLRYFIWIAGVGKCFIGQCDLGVTVQNQPVTVLLAQAAGSTLQLVTIASVIAIILGLVVGITTALRQYSGYDYGVTFLSFLFFSLPIFWVAVLLKQFVAIGFNDFLSDPQIAPWIIPILAVISGLIWMSILPGKGRRKLITFAAAALASAAVIIYMDLSDWFSYPHIGIVGVALTLVGAAFGVTTISTGLKNRRALYASLVVAGIGVAAWYPFIYFTTGLPFWGWIGIGVATVLVALGVGWFMGGDDRRPVARTAAIVGFIAFSVLSLDRFMQVWDDYANSGRIKGRPIATIGSGTPGLEGSLWVHGVDLFTHLLLPTLALILISFATYTRYSRASLLEVMNQDYIRTARAKGLTERTVVVRHAFRNALIPIATIVAFDIGGIIGGAVITERVFGWTGMGALFQNGLDHVDPNPVMAFFLVTGSLAILFNLIADLVYAGLDPRIRVS
ncbi:MAG: ABC transporter permease [Actinobacteria bacterium]|nr:ABC transporter permease [Actinomycetota bacterium]